MLVTNTFNASLKQESKEHWLSYWKHFNAQSSSLCAEANCTEKAEHGVLVKKVGKDTESLFVIPLCTKHSENFVHHIEVDENISLVEACHTL